MWPRVESWVTDGCEHLNASGLAVEAGSQDARMIAAAGAALPGREGVAVTWAVTVSYREVWLVCAFPPTTLPSAVLCLPKCFPGSSHVLLAPTSTGLTPRRSLSLTASNPS